jgi:acetate kinase
MTGGGSVLAVNAGSSSIKFAVFGPGLERRLHGELEGTGAQPVLTAQAGDRAAPVREAWEGGDVSALTRRLVGWIEAHLGAGALGAIGHRVAIGGLGHSGPALVTPALIEKLRALVPLAPLHQPRNLEPIEVLGRSHPHLPQVACFDTAFHRTLPREAQLYGLPRELTDAGALRYGFHGLSYEYIASRLPEIDPRAARGRAVVCHLGSGASMCALREGRSVATTMGFSPLSGLVMATRPGDLDPGLMIWLMRERGLDVDQVEGMLYHTSGLRGVSGISGDMRELLASDAPEAGEAVALFVYRVAAELGRLAAALEGLDALVFTAGIGEHAAEIRRAVCARATWLGVRLEAGANEAGALKISAADSAVSVWVVPTDEERMLATHTARLALGRAEAEEAGQ